jgi:hypothetical protein
MLIGFVLMGEDLIEMASSRFPLSIGYYVTLWGFSAACIIGGGLALAKRPVGRWIVVATAVIAALNQLWLVLAYASDSNRMWAIQVAAFMVFALAVAVVMARKQPNSAIARDGPQAARPSL